MNIRQSKDSQKTVRRQFSNTAPRPELPQGSRLALLPAPVRRQSAIRQSEDSQKTIGRRHFCPLPQKNVIRRQTYSHTTVKRQLEDSKKTARRQSEGVTSAPCYKTNVIKRQSVIRQSEDSPILHQARVPEQVARPRQPSHVDLLHFFITLEPGVECPKRLCALTRCPILDEWTVSPYLCTLVGEMDQPNPKLKQPRHQPPDKARLME